MSASGGRASVHAIGLAVLGALGGGCVESHNIVDEAPVVRAVGPHLEKRAQEAPPAWAVPLAAAGADAITFLSQGTLLVATIRYEGSLLAKEPVGGAIVAMDAASGRTLWTVERGGTPGKTGVLTTAPALWLRLASGERCRIARINPTDGHEQAHVEVPCGAFGVDPSGARAVFAAPTAKGTQPNLVSVELKNGAVEWSKPIAASQLDVAPDHITVVADKTLAVLDAATGSVGATVDAGGPIAWVRPLDDGESLVVTESPNGKDPLSAVVLLSAKGAVSWKAKLGRGSVGSVATTKTAIAVALDADDISSVVSLFDRKTGSITWKHADTSVAGGLSFAPPATGAAASKGGATDLLLVASIRRGKPLVHEVVALGTTNGAVVFKADVAQPIHPPFGVGYFPFPDRLVETRSGVVFVGPTAFARVDLAARALREVHAFRGSLAYKGPCTGGNPLQIARLQAAADRLASSGSARGEAGRQMGGTTGAIVSMAGAMESIQAAQWAQVAANTSAAEARRAFRSALRAQAYVNTLQGDLVVKPIHWTWGQGLSLLDTTSGRWLELVTGPPEKLFTAYLLLPPVFAISPDGSMLVTTGAALRVDSAEQDSGFQSFKTVGRRILGFKIDKSRFRAPAEYEAASMVGMFDEVESPE